jgi:hypothetical protein
LTPSFQALFSVFARKRKLSLKANSLGFVIVMKVAVSGKGGVGKTLIAGGLARGFVERGA